MHALRSAERFASLQRELIPLATIDPLTGLCNRHGFFEQATQVRARTGPDRKLSAILLDIDNFKHINASYGHEAGDEAIRACAEAARFDEAVAGDEFALLLERPLPESLEIAKGLRRRLASRPVKTRKGPITLTWSIGVGEAQPQDSVDQILARADAALYNAKTQGRNCVASAPSGLRMKETVAQHGIARAKACSEDLVRIAW